MGIHDLVIDGTKHDGTYYRDYYDIEFRTNDKKPYPYWEMYRSPEIKGNPEIKKIFIYNVSSIKDINEVKREVFDYFKNEKRVE